MEARASGISTSPIWPMGVVAGLHERRRETVKGWGGAAALVSARVEAGIPNPFILAGEETGSP
jgi:hypothetical protein